MVLPYASCITTDGKTWLMLAHNTLVWGNIKKQDKVGLAVQQLVGKVCKDVRVRLAFRVVLRLTCSKTGKGVLRPHHILSARHHHVACREDSYQTGDANLLPRHAQYQPHFDFNGSKSSTESHDKTSQSYHGWQGFARSCLRETG